MAEKDKNAPKKSDPDPHEGARPEDELAPAVTVINTGGPGPDLPNTQPIDIVNSVPLPVDIRVPAAPVPVTLQGPVPVNVTMRRPEPPNIDDDPSLILNVAIRNRSEAISFNRYQEFINRILCGTGSDLG